MKTVTAIAEAIKEFFKFQSTGNIRRMKAAIEASEKYIQVNENEGEFKKLTKTRKAKLLKHYRKRFFAYN